ncbi:tryptophan dehydrogenase ScyB [Microseira sp. BLCC-F43]|uniref:tryptophan dehydrogenase ScyB n=1 Tax=Microseira sp. BLCC-F43 TaxID=3153602 RepID=UPI0035BA0869
MNLFESTEKMGHEQVLFCHDNKTNLKAIIAIHDAGLGSAMGATRLWPYASEEEALKDALRLSRGMTYKAACAGIPVGGGKAVIIAKPEHKTDEMLEAYGRFVDSLNGRFITGQDVNLCPEDVRTIRRVTRHVVGVSEQAGGPAVTTALGVFLGIKAAVGFRLPHKELNQIRVAVQGAGNVGKNLCQLLHQAGAEIFVTDLSRERTEEIKELYGATIVQPEEIYSLDVDVFAPCALGGVINCTTLMLLKAPIIAGCANNQLEDEVLHTTIMESKEILYCPDYVINAGGLINVYGEMIGANDEEIINRVSRIYDTLFEIFFKAKREHITTHDASKRLAEERIMKAKNQKMLAKTA